jgi:hypothetical protein
MTTRNCSRCYIALYIYRKKTCYEYEGYGGLNHNNQQPTENLALTTTHTGQPATGPREQISGWNCIVTTASHSATVAVAGAETLYICTK